MSEKLKDLELRSEEVQEILTKVPNWMIRRGNTLFFLLIVLIIVLAWFIKYPDIISSEAMVTTKVSPQKEFANITGKLDTIFVTDNQNIHKNQPLALIENSANYTDVFYLKSVLDTITVNKKSFSFPIEQLPILFLGEIDQSFANFENNYLQYLLNKQLNPYLNDQTTNKISEKELKTRLYNLQAQKNIHKKELALKKNDVNRNKKLFDQGVVAAKDYEVKQLEYLQAARNYQNMNATISQLREALATSKKNIQGTEITRVREEITLLKNMLQSFNQLKKAVKDWERTYVFISNISGKVSFLKYWNKNQTVTKGDLVFTIIPNDHSSYIAKLKTPAQNSGKIKIGQQVHIKLQNYPDYEFGVLKGNVHNISAIPDKEGFYTVDVTLPEKLVTSYHKEITFKHEMRGTAEIITENVRLLQRLFYQFNKLSDR